MACYPVAYLGLMIAPHDLAVLWAVIVGVGTCTFPLILTFIGLRSRTPSGTAALSGFTQSAGYLLAAVGPFTVGLLHDATGGWTVPLAFLMSPRRADGRGRACTSPGRCTSRTSCGSGHAGRTMSDVAGTNPARA